MKRYDPKSIWPEDLVRYKEILDNNPNYAVLAEEDKVRIADRIMHSTYADLTDNLLDKQAAMDVTCKTSDGRQFVVEMQTNRKIDFKNRLFYYGASAIHRQVKAGSKKYFYDSVRVIAILDFITKHSDEPKDMAHRCASTCWNSPVCRKRSRTRTILTNGAICSGIFLNLSAYRKRLTHAFTN